MLYESSSLMQEGEVNIPSNTLCKSPTLCILILRTEIVALVTISDMWGSEMDKKYLHEDFNYGFCRYKTYMILYSGEPVRSEIPRGLYCKETVLGINGGCCHWLDQKSIWFALSHESEKMCRWGKLWARASSTKTAVRSSANSCHSLGHPRWGIKEATFHWSQTHVIVVIMLFTPLILRLSGGKGSGKGVISPVLWHLARDWEVRYIRDPCLPLFCIREVWKSVPSLQESASMI